MMIKVLGSAQDAGVPHVACHCATCMDARRNPQHARRGPAIGIYDEVGGGTWMIDASPDFDVQLEMLWESVREVRPRNRFPLDGLFLTHAHFGHYWGLGFLGKEACSPKGLPVYCTPDMQKFLAQNRPFADLIARENILIYPVEHGVDVPVHPELTITPYKVEHRRDFTDTVAYILKGSRQTILYVPDMDDVTPDIAELIGRMDVALIDGCFYSGAELPGRDIREVPHPLIPDTMDLLQDQVRSTEIVFTHFNHSNHAIHPESEEGKKVVARGFGLAADGDEFAL
jgi:pyrroloquinoline quinone biosynthesis protein B